MSLTHKYRPKTLDQVIGQSPIVKALNGAITKNRIHNAYLFCGSRGTGKTSVARVLAKSLNCQKGQTVHPCGECHSCKTIESGNSIDVFEVDAASNNGVDYARELIKGTALSSMGGRYKIYIIDECHNLTKQASEALLKTVEEPGSKTVFIFCTTEPGKVLKTIESRCQVFKFKSVDEDTITNHLKNITASEFLDIDRDLIPAIAQVSDGVVRDAVILLDQLSLSPDSSIEDLYQMVGRIPSDGIINMLNAVSSGKSINVYAELKELFRSGVDPLQVITEMANFIRNGLIYRQDYAAYKLMTCDTATFKAAGNWAKTIPVNKLEGLLIFLRKREIDLSAAKIPKLFLESTLLEMMHLITLDRLPPIPSNNNDVNTKKEESNVLGIQLDNQLWQRISEQPIMSKLNTHITRAEISNNSIKVWLPIKFKDKKDIAILRLQEACNALSVSMNIDVLFCD